MDLDTRIKMAVYGHFAQTGRRPSPVEVGERASAPVPEVLSAYARLRAHRVLALEADGASILMAPPFSGVPTPHTVSVGGTDYFANCAWDALGITAALHRRGQVRSRCEQSKAPLVLSIGLDGPEPSSWLFHSLVPAAKWWDDIVFT